MQKERAKIEEFGIQRVRIMKTRTNFFKKANFHIFLLILATTAFQACSTSNASRGEALADGTEISALGALGKLETAPSGPLYSGDGGKNIRLAVLAPQIQGEAPEYLPIYIQGLLNNNFNKFSAVNLIDRQNLDRIISEQKITTSGNYSDNDFVRIGNLTNAQYFLFGTIQKLSGDTYSLQLSVTDSSTGVRKANFMKNGSLSQLEGRGTLINEATAELLSQLGVQLTETGLQTLLAGNTSVVKAEAGLARGITAQAGGSEIEALFNFTQAITFDPSQIEALSRLNILSSTISGGTISQRIVTDIQARDSWLNAFKDTARFLNEHPPFEIIFDPNLIQIGETDYTKRTANIGMRIALDPSQAGFSALNALLEGLEKTGRRGVWGFSGWPLMEISPRTTGTVVFGGKRSFSYKVDVALINERNKTLGNSSITLTTESISFSAGDKIVTPPFRVYDVVSFRNIKAQDLTPTLTIVIRAVNGISSRNLNASGYMKIETGDLEHEEYFELGKKNFEQKDFDQAIVNFTKAIRLNPNYARAYYYRGDAYGLLYDPNLALADCTQAIRLDPNNAEAYFHRGNVYMYAYYKSQSKQDVDRAIADHTQAIRLNPNYAEAYYWRGNMYSSYKSDYDSAIADYTQAIRINPDHAHAYRSRGNVYRRWKGDYNRAIADFTQAIRLFTNSRDPSLNGYWRLTAYIDRGDAYYDKGDYNRAIADYTQAIRLDSIEARQKLEKARQARGW
jgi:tetratricopeptide (TPR) repeat protein